MRVAALYDVHGNLPALEAALADADKAGADLLLFGGDLISGPMPLETLERLTAIGERAMFIRGNADRMLVEAYDGAVLDSTLGRFAAGWAASQITREGRDFLADLPDTVALELEGLGKVLFCHATPRNDLDVFTIRTPDQRVQALFGEVDADVVVCGHTHMAFDRRVDGMRVVNAGSVGMPYGERGAHWALLGPDVELRRVDYDYEGAAALIRSSDWPGAQEFADENVVSVPSEEEALAVFEPLND